MPINLDVEQKSKKRKEQASNDGPILFPRYTKVNHEVRLDKLDILGMKKLAHEVTVFLAEPKMSEDKFSQLYQWLEEKKKALNSGIDKLEKNDNPWDRSVMAQYGWLKTRLEWAKNIYYTDYPPSTGIVEVSGRAPVTAESPQTMHTEKRMRPSEDETSSAMGSSFESTINAAGLSIEGEEIPSTLGKEKTPSYETLNPPSTGITASGEEQGTQGMTTTEAGTTSSGVGSFESSIGDAGTGMSVVGEDVASTSAASLTKTSGRDFAKPKSKIPRLKRDSVSRAMEEEMKERQRFITTVEQFLSEKKLDIFQKDPEFQTINLMIFSMQTALSGLKKGYDLDTENHPNYYKGSIKLFRKLEKMYTKAMTNPQPLEIESSEDASASSISKYRGTFFEPTNKKESDEAKQLISVTATF